LSVFPLERPCNADVGLDSLAFDPGAVPTLIGRNRKVELVASTDFGSSPRYETPRNLRADDRCRSSRGTPSARTAEHLYYNYNLQVEKGLGSVEVLQVGCVGNEGRKEVITENINQFGAFAPCLSGCPYPNVGTINQLDDEVFSNYNSLQAVLRVRSWQRSSSQFACTWAHALDEASEFRGVQWVNPAVFCAPSPTCLPNNPNGNLARNAFYGPGFADVDLSVFKNVPITERFKLQLRSEMFNAFNRKNLASGEGSVGSSGRVTDTIGDFFGGPGLGPGEPFNMQIAAKIIF
jgi:hypothetical protein